MHACIPWTNYCSGHIGWHIRATGKTAPRNLCKETRQPHGLSPGPAVSFQSHEIAWALFRGAVLHLARIFFDHRHDENRQQKMIVAMAKIMGQTWDGEI